MLLKAEYILYKPLLGLGKIDWGVTPLGVKQNWSISLQNAWIIIYAILLKVSTNASNNILRFVFSVKHGKFKTCKW